MTLNCDLPLEAARDEFAKSQDDGTARDLIESAFEYWKSDQIDDAALAMHLRAVLQYLERFKESEGGPPARRLIAETKSALEILSLDQIAALREAGFVVIHREPTEAMCKAFYGNEYPESVIFVEGFHRVVATSIRAQNKSEIKQ
jgi:hypothetical protein